MIKRFKVSNFKNFKNELVLDFSKRRDYLFNENLIKNGLVNKAIVYGYNSSGKSNLGFAIMDITTHLTDNAKLEFHYMLPINLESNKPTSKFTYEFIFNGVNITYIYEKDISRRLVYEEVLVENETKFYYDYKNNTFKNEFEDLKNINLDNRTENLSALKYIRNNVFEFKDDNPIKLIVDFANEMLWFRSLRENEFMGKLPNGDNISDYIIRNNQIKEFQDFLNECDLNEKICVLETPNGPVLGSVKGNKTVPFFAISSTGTACLTLFYYWKSSCFNKIKFLYLDEFDAFYHEKLSTLLLKKVFENPGFQCVVTTHNSTLATNELTRPDAIMILKNNKLKSLSDLTDKTLREGHNLRKLMEAGEFDEE